MNDMASKLSGTTKNMTSGLMADPQKLESIISMVRTVAPLTTPQTVTKVNTYLPPFEKLSTLIGMYSFLNKAQTFRPIESMNAKSPADMMTALMKSGSMPIGKMIAQPLIATNMEKIMGTVASNMFKNTDLNDMLKNVNINEMLSSISKNTGNKDASSSDNSGIDLNSLMETFMPIMNSMKPDSVSHDETAAGNSYEKGPEKIELKNESYLPYDDTEYKKEEAQSNNYNSNNLERPANTPPDSYYDRNYENNHFEQYEKAVNYEEHKNNYNEKKDIQRPIRIKQRKRR
jgi:hypothetical protein